MLYDWDHVNNLPNITIFLIYIHINIMKLNGGINTYLGFTVSKTFCMSLYIFMHDQNCYALKLTKYWFQNFLTTGLNLHFSRLCKPSGVSTVYTQCIISTWTSQIHVLTWWQHCLCISPISFLLILWLCWRALLHTNTVLRLS